MVRRLQLGHAAMPHTGLALTWKSGFDRKISSQSNCMPHQLAARRIDSLETHYVTGASPLCGRSAADFLRHFQKNLDR